jgi:hypothetical protein
VFCIRVNEVSIDGKELKSMLELSSAMIGKREIVVSYRRLEQIQNGRTIIFGQCGFFKKHIRGSNKEVRYLFYSKQAYNTTWHTPCSE